MEVKVMQEPDLVVAIDIGSSCSGYAWQRRSDFLNNRSNVQFNTNWECGKYQMHKTSTCILLKYQQVQKGNGRDSSDELYENYKIQAFGGEAEDEFRNLNGGQEDKCFFFKCFKHILQVKGFRKDIKVEDHLGRHVPFQIVMTKFIEALKDHFIIRMKEKRQDLSLDKTLWVITVPAIWSDEAKSFMREAAERSGINKNNLLLALEAEVAALYCLYLPKDQRGRANDLKTPGHVFLTAVLGGLTADLYAVKVEEDGSLNEVCMAEGKVYGGRDLQNAFFQACIESLEGDTFRELFQKVKLTGLMEMEGVFEQMKAPDVDKKLELKNDEKTYSSVFIRDTRFKEPCQIICKRLTETLKMEELTECKTLVLVGGLIEAPIVVEHITDTVQKEFPNVEIVVPTSPFEAVLKGSVLFGHDPMIFRSRISRYTYGVGTCSLFKEGIHDPRKKWLNTENKSFYCNDILSVHVNIGQSVILKEHQKQMVYHPMYKDQKCLTFGIYSSTKVPLTIKNVDNSVEGLMYTTDESCQKLGEVKVETPDTSLGTNRKIMVWMIYGGTELSVFAKDETSGNENRAEITFTNI